MKKRSKRYRNGAEKVEARTRYALEDALRILRDFPAAKFDETVELALKLGIDPTKSDQIVRGAVALPRGIGKSRKVIVFAEGEKASAALEAGAAEVGTEDLAARIQGGWLDFDVAIASPDMMRHVAKLGRILGPQGKMPSPKAGTVTDDVATAVREFAAGKIEYRNDDGGNVHAPVGKRSFDDEALRVNIEAFIDHIVSHKPSGVKGQFLVSATLSASMSPGVALAV